MTDPRLCCLVRTGKGGNTGTHGGQIPTFGSISGIADGALALVEKALPCRSPGGHTLCLAGLSAGLAVSTCAGQSSLFSGKWRMNAAQKFWQPLCGGIFLDASAHFAECWAPRFGSVHLDILFVFFMLQTLFNPMNSDLISSNII